MQRLVRVLVVDIVSDANELALFVRAAQEDHGHADDLAVGDAGEVRGICLEDKLIDADRDRTNEDGVELLVVLIAAELLAGSCRIGGIIFYLLLSCRA